MASYADLLRLLLDQWGASPRLRALVADGAAPIRDDALEALGDLARMAGIDDAEGVWLDRIGGVLGVARPSVADPAQDPRWGFGPAGEPFDQAPFRGSEASDALFPLPDAQYRRLLRARAALALGDGTLATFVRAVRMIDPSATVEDHRTMLVSVTTARRDQLELADRAGALPRSAGVRVRYRDRGRFGWDAAGEPFDQGAYAPV